MGWNIERTREGEAMFQQRETEKQRKISESSQVMVGGISFFIVAIKSVHLGHCVASSSLYRVSLIQPHKIWKMSFYQENYRQVLIKLLKNNTYRINCVLNWWSFQQAMVETVAENYHNIWAKKKKKELDSKGDAFLLGKVLFGSILSMLSQVHWLIVCCHRKEEEVIHYWYRTTRWQRRRSTETERKPRSSLNSCRSMDMPLAGQCTNKFCLV